MDSIYWGSTEDLVNYNKEQFQKFLNLNKEEIKSLCFEDGRLKHILRAEHFDLDFLNKICDTANAARRISKLEDNYLKGLLRSKSILNYFSQPSSRTFFSFSSAEAHLGMKREELRDLKTSSSVKGESERDSLRTISSYFDALVVRHPSDLYDLFVLWVMKNTKRELPIINAGSGTMEHPTQGILDYYTIRESFDGKIDRRVVLFVGDCKRGRTIHSIAKILSLHKNITMYFVAPEHLQIDDETEEYIKKRGTIVHKTDKPLKEVITFADVIYMTRIQNEHGGDGKADLRYIFTKDMLDMIREGAILMHPMPKREEIDPSIDDIKDDKRVMYWRQQRNGMWCRVALLAYIFKVDFKIREHFERIKKSVAPKPL
ncbi:hypothetical protein J4216_03835 [Candidatus Woesearchaeota archaeon]|nr:hypothetical protein [Candidatus Woesearchaeota archaeon]